MTSPIEVVVGREQVDPSNFPVYSPSQLTLYGIPLSRLRAPIGGSETAVTNITVNVNCSGERVWFTALVYAYAYQGHCYHLPEPTLLTLPYQGPPDPAAGYGFEVSNFKMWRVDKLDRAMQLEMTSDTFEELILKRGLQGTKQPMAYASRASISHRGGRLNE